MICHTSSLTHLSPLLLFLPLHHKFSKPVETLEDPIVQLSCKASPRPTSTALARWCLAKVVAAPANCNKNHQVWTISAITIRDDSCLCCSMGMVTLVDVLPMFCNLQSTSCLIWCIIVTYIHFHMSSLKCMPWQINEVVISTDSPADGDSARTKEEAKNVAPWGHTPCGKQWCKTASEKTKKSMLKVR